jgi:hypothetical protein
MYYVVAMNYQGGTRRWQHRTLKAAYRRLGSVIKGKLSRRDDMEAYIVDPLRGSERISSETARNIIEDGTP